MRFVVLGAGAVGGFVAAALHHSGADVLAVARGQHLRMMRERGLIVNTPEGSWTAALAVSAEPDLRDGDIVLLAVKSQDTIAALEMVRTADVPIVCLQNGIANEELALRRFANVYGAFVFLPVTFLQPGVVESELTPVPGIIDVGRYPSGIDSVARDVSAALAAAGPGSRTDDAIMRWKYAKLLGNLGNAVQAVCAPGDDANTLIDSARAEGVACLQAAGIDYATDEEMTKRRDEALAVSRLGGGRAGGSTWQSLQRRTGSVETDYLNGEIVLLGRKLGIRTPVNETLQALAAELARRNAPPGVLSASDVLSRALTS